MISFNKEQIFIVTGASSGIGEGVALFLNELGATVIGIARNQERLDAMKAKSQYPENMFIEVKDLVEDIEGLPEYIKTLKNNYGKLHGLAYCAGILDISPLQILDYSKMKELYDVNYFAPIFMTKGLADKRNNIGKGTSVVYISSIAAAVCNKGMTSYCGSKAALIASARCIAKELGNRGIRINSISPADIQTEMQNISNATRTEFVDFPMGIGEISDVATFVAFLLSDKSKWITAQNYNLDCGTYI